MTGEVIQTKAKEFLQKIYGDANSEFNFSICWLERFKARHEIKSYRRFGESGSIVMENIEDVLPQIRAKLEIFNWKDIYNMDETGLFYRLQANHSLATKQLEGRKNDKERLTVVLCCKGNGSDKVPLWVIGRNVLLIVDNCPAHPKPTTIANYFRHCKIQFEEDMPLQQEIGDVEGIHKLKEVISYLHYRNVMDVEWILNYPSEHEPLKESPTNEEIIQEVMDVSADDEQYRDDNSVLPYVSPI
ncbi:CENP-B homolog protein 2-like [Gossypium arboreum]|uniref:CENP-B homolog protein 2-like n=1 Tax=Gossypium arboreum TaxID=29729 RepID=UPI0008192DD1|nr:CENP-B homolog protein 2-like [Gossypium arboreum]